MILSEPPLVVDTDFLSSFAWVNRLDILESLFSAQMLILEEVQIEIAKVPHLSAQVDICIENKTIIPTTMSADSPEAIELARYLGEGKYGRGESACMAYLSHNEGTMGSNNLADVGKYCLDNSKQILCTGHCLRYAIESKVVRFEECESLWQRMLSKRRKLPTATFQEYWTSFPSTGIT